MLDLKFILLLILAYLLGSFPTGVLVGKLFFQKDIRDYGSGNIGTTNTFRVLGPKAGSLVFAVDFLKGTVAALIPIWFKLGPNYLSIIFGLAAILGHAFSIFLNFKGGKAVATTAGFLLGYNWHFFLVCALIFFPTLFITSMVSLTSLISVIAFFLLSWLYHDMYLTTLLGLLVILIFWSHRSNIVRIHHRTENLVPFGLLYWLTQKNKRSK